MIVKLCIVLILCLLPCENFCQVNLQISEAELDTFVKKLWNLEKSRIQPNTDYQLNPQDQTTQAFYDEWIRRIKPPVRCSLPSTKQN
ncbi:hypothetical protein EG68_00817 [Paragonimus skrjabini miyazakii]|uniref:Uncharacterized protein n=1 Tax=Paragonimus skrjabini miyazakii TaxID=59628 RepID=A0A8S9ZC50_9TREM|nr:hypothetical protein EG68_00817 [Paragonimus skrjabini miyazakii]